MKCVICRHGQTRKGEISITLERGGTTLVFKKVPAEVCDNCGEEYVDDATTARLLGAADQASRSGVELEVRTYVAA